jgi:hypothetical protein
MEDSLNLRGKKPQARFNMEDSLNLRGKKPQAPDSENFTTSRVGLQRRMVAA